MGLRGHGTRLRTARIDANASTAVRVRTLAESAAFAMMTVSDRGDVVLVWRPCPSTSSICAISTPSGSGVVARRFVGRGIRARWGDTRGMRVLGHRLCDALSRPVPRGGGALPRLHAGGAGRGEMAVGAADARRAGRRDSTCRCRMPRSTACCSCMRSKWRTTPAALLREVWRVLAAGGRLLAVVPNRRGVWARIDTTPFGHGRPYSRSQITASAARDLVHADRLGRGALRAADRARLVPALGGRLGAHRRDASRRRSRACTSSRRPSRSIARFRRGASGAGWCRRSSRRSRRRRRGADVDQDRDDAGVAAFRLAGDCARLRRASARPAARRRRAGRLARAAMAAAAAMQREAVRLAVVAVLRWPFGPAAALGCGCAAGDEGRQAGRRRRRSGCCCGRGVRGCCGC